LSQHEKETTPKKLQCSREYWDEEGDKRATAIHELSREEQIICPQKI